MALILLTLVMSKLDVIRVLNASRKQLFESKTNYLCQNAVMYFKPHLFFYF